MSLWSYNNNKWIGNDWRKAQAGSTAILACPGPSLAQAPEDMRGPGRTVIALNTAYPRVKPDIWLGMDTLDCYHPSLPYESFIKVFRGNYHDIRTDSGDTIKHLPFNYFSDVTKADGIKDILTRSDDDLKLVWFKHSLAAALHLIKWMGYKRIVFVGCDMGGGSDYYDDRVLTEKQRSGNRLLYTQQVDFLKQFVALPSGITCISATPCSPINEFMDTATVQSFMTSDTKPFIPRHATEAFEEPAVVDKKVGVVTPTRGDRPKFMAMCEMMIQAQTVQPAFSIVVDHAPTTEGNDQRDRVSFGIEKARDAGCTHILIMEDDDYYKPDHIEKTLAAWSDEDVIGGFFYDIYHIKSRKHVEYHGDMNFGTGVKGAPLHSTGFSVAAWDRFVSSGWLGTRRNLDDEVWGWAQEKDIKRTWVKEHTVLSMKHGIGKTAGGCHSDDAFDNRGTHDSDGSYLESIVGSVFRHIYLGCAPLVSVITVCYGDYHKYKDGYLDMISKQTYPNVEVILVDEESFTPLEHNLPVAAARNIGAAKAKGAYLVFVDVDDTMYPEYIAKVVASGKDLVTTYVDVTGYLPTRLEPKPGITLDQFAKGSQYVSLFACSREVFSSTRGYDVTMDGWEDHELWMQFVSLGHHVHVIPEYLCAYNRSGKGLGAHCWGIRGRLNEQIRERYPELFGLAEVHSSDPCALAVSLP